jgi:hypothetical protein
MHLEQQVRIWKDRFKDHRALDFVNPMLDLSQTIGNPRVIVWEKPGTHIESIRFILSGTYLCCVGDLGDSVLQWSQIITPQFLATCDFHYWFGKKRAWPGANQDWKQWEESVAASWANDQVNDFRTEERDVPGWCVQLVEKNGCLDTFTEVASEVYDATGDSELASSISRAGLVPDCNAISQWVGLQMALHKLGIRKEAL